MAPPTYNTKLQLAHRNRDTSFVRKRPYPLKKPTAPVQRKTVLPASRRAVPSQEHKKPTKSSTSSTVAATAKATSNTTSKAVEKPKEGIAKNVVEVEKSKKAVDLMDFDDDLDIKGLREEPASEGHYELNPLMSRVLEKELQTIMIKVWQDLPDKPPTAAEKVVVDKLRTEAGDDLKNVLGLNVSKRLLNIHNPLYVKVSLSRKPDRVSLKEFVQAYNCIGLKYVPSQSQQHYTFVAQFKHFADFDRICTTKIVRCGNERVSIVPCYKFTTCPPHLKSIYSDNSSQNLQKSEESQIDKTVVKAEDNKGGITVKTEDQNNQNTGEQKPAESKGNTNTTTKITNLDQIKKENEVKKDNVVIKETKTNSSTPKPVVKKVEESPTTKTNANQTKKAEVTPTKANQKPLPAKATPTTPQVAKTTAAAKTQPGNVTPAKTQSGNANPVKTEPNKITVTKTQQQNAATSVKSETVNTPTKTPQKVQPQKANPTKPAQTPTPQKPSSNAKDTPKIMTKPNTNKKPIAKIPQKVNAKITTEEDDLTAKINEMIAIDEVYEDDAPIKAEDDEVLNDEDILALMSGAIVLDECRGSDEE